MSINDQAREVELSLKKQKLFHEGWYDKRIAELELRLSDADSFVGVMKEQQAVQVERFEKRIAKLEEKNRQLSVAKTQGDDVYALQETNRLQHERIQELEEELTRRTCEMITHKGVAICCSTPMKEAFDELQSDCNELGKLATDKASQCGCLLAENSYLKQQRDKLREALQKIEHWSRKGMITPEGYINTLAQQALKDSGEE